MGKKTIRVDEDAFEVAKERKEANGQTWDEYIADDQRSAPDADDIATSLTAKLNVDADDAKDELNEVKRLIEDMNEDIDQLESNMTNVDAGGLVTNDSKEIKDVLNRLDDLESQLPRQVAEELKG